MKLVIAEKPSVAQSIAATLGVKEKKDGYIEGGDYLISWCVGYLVRLAEVAGCKKPMRRLWISSMEDATIRSSFDNLKNGRDYDALFAPALCRSKADWIIGINATRLFSCLYNRTLNVGRVQTAIKNKKQPYFAIKYGRIKKGVVTKKQSLPSQE